MSSEENKVTEETPVNKPDENMAGSSAAEAESEAEIKDVEQAAEHMEMQSDFSREQWILTHIGDENLMEYLRMEHKKEEEVRKAKEAKQKRILSAFQLTVSLAAVIVVMFLLRDNPTVMVNILYIIAIVAALWIWKNPRS